MALKQSLQSFLTAALLLTSLAPIAHAQSADVTVVKTGPALAAADTDVTYDITVTNFGPDDAAAVTLHDAIPAGMTFVSETHDAAFSCSFPAIGDSGSIDCTSALLAANASANFTFVVHIPPGTPDGTDFTNVATVSDPTDPNDENNSSTVVTSTPPPPQSDLGVTKTGPSFAGADTDVTYSLTFSNAGPDPATEASLFDTLPGDMTFVSITQDSGPAMSCTPGATTTCTAATFPAGAIATFTLVGHIPAGTSGGTSYSNVVTVSNANDFNEENNEAQTTLIVATVDVSVTKSGPPSVNAATNVSYTITVANSQGSDAATNVELTDVLPPGTTFVSLTPDNGIPPSFCGTPTAGTNGTVTCSFAAFPGGATSQLTLVINSGSAASIANTATVTTESYDTDPSNDSDTANTSVTQSADLGVTKNGPPTVTAGNDVTYTVAINNAGPSDAVSVSLTDTLPANLTFVSATQTSGPTFNCTGTSTITCTIATFAANSSATFDFVAHVASSTPSGTSIANTATVTSATFDPSSPNTSTTTATTATSADVSVTKTGPAAVAPGTDITYNVTVANTGPSDAANVSLTDTAPTGTTFVSVTQTSGPTFNCTGGATTTCTIASLAANASATFQFVMHVDPTTTGTISNTANVTSTTADPTPGNGTSTSAPAAVSPATTDVSITKTVASPLTNRFAPGSNATYTITATNNGPAFATSVTVTDVLPAGTTFVSATPSQGSCLGTTTVVCSVGVLAPSASATITLVVTLPQTFGPVENTATVTSANADSNPANNAATATLATTSEIPSLSPLALLVLALTLAALGAFVTRM